MHLGQDDNILILNGVYYVVYSCCVIEEHSIPPCHCLFCFLDERLDSETCRIFLAIPDLVNFSVPDLNLTLLLAGGIFNKVYSCSIIVSNLSAPEKRRC